MTILYTSTQVRREIKRLFTESKGRRVVISAFVGGDAHVYLPRPEGIELICWPKAGGTNPDAIRDLIARGVKVFFADAVHMKIYWTSDKGAIVTSANLSTNALGEGGLKEVGVSLPKGRIEINRIIKSLSISEASKAELLKLDKEHKAAWKKNPSHFAKTSSPISFDKWHESEARSVWKLTSYRPAKVSLSKESKSVLEREHGSVSYEDILEHPEYSFHEDDWVLCFNVNNTREMNWIFAHHVIPSFSQVKKLNPISLHYQVIQVKKLGRNAPCPFQLDTAFKTAFVKAVGEFGGTEKIEELRKAIPSPKLIDIVYKHYISKR